MRIGVHSGPVTAGVLRGEKSRFQLFGDTVNTASYLESTGKPNVIHLSHTTAALLKQAGKGHRLVERKDPVCVKGKGEMQTFWLDTSSRTKRKKLMKGMSLGFKASSRDVGSDSGDRRNLRRSTNAKLPIERNQLRHQTSLIWGNSASVASIDSSGTGVSNDLQTENTFSRLVDWNVELLLGLLKKVVSFHSSGYLAINSRYVLTFLSSSTMKTGHKA
jgi:Adenylate and Guanylate cyclase catalytic domain